MAKNPRRDKLLTRDRKSEIGTQKHPATENRALPREKKPTSKIFSNGGRRLPTRINTFNFNFNFGVVVIFGISVIIGVSVIIAVDVIVVVVVVVVVVVIVVVIDRLN